jgi:hypothetical protein
MLTANFVQDGWRLRNDDGNQATATWIAALNTSAGVSVGQTFRIRIRVTETAGGGTAFTGPLEYNRSGLGWNSVTTSSAVMRLVTSSNVADNTATTDQLGGGGTFVAGVVESNGTYSSPALTSQRTEIEFVVQLIAADVANGNTVEFRISGLNSYTVTGSLTVVTPGVLDQSAWRWRGDNGSESAASWLAATDTAASFNIGSGNVNARLRLALTETLGAGRNAVAPQLQMGVEGGEPDSWTQRTSSFGTTSILSVAYGNGVWVAVGSSGALATATDPTGTWTQRTSSFGATSIRSVAYGNGVWVAVGSSGALATATDPTGTWTQRTSSFGATTINSVTYGNGVWVAAGNAGALATATDPTGTWTQRTSSFGATTINSVTYGNGVWVAVGGSGALATATDPTGTWTQRTSSFGTTFIRSVAYGNGVWVAVGDTGALATATDPTGTWTQRTSSFGTTTIRSVTYSNGVWVAVGDTSKLATATDPTGTWTQRTSSFGATSILSVAYSNGVWVAVAIDGALATSNALAWTNITTSSTPVRAFDSSNLTHGGNTTQQITSGTFVSSNAGVSETGTAGPTTFAGSDRAEYEFTVTFLAASLADGDQILFRLV